MLIYRKHLDVVDLLVKHGADVDVKNNKGFTPCHLAVNVDLVVVVQTLLKRDCDVNTQVCAELWYSGYAMYT